MLKSDVRSKGNRDFLRFVSHKIRSEYMNDVNENMENKHKEQNDIFTCKYCGGIGSKKLGVGVYLPDKKEMTYYHSICYHEAILRPHIRRIERDAIYETPKNSY